MKLLKYSSALGILLWIYFYLFIYSCIYLFIYLFIHSFLDLKKIIWFVSLKKILLINYYPVNHERLEKSWNRTN